MTTLDELIAEWRRRTKAIGRDVGSYRQCANELETLLSAAPSGQAPIAEVNHKLDKTREMLKAEQWSHEQSGKARDEWRARAEAAMAALTAIKDFKPDPNIGSDPYTQISVFAKDTARSALLAPPASGAVEAGWQTMESAPKDGRRALLWAKQWEAPCTGQFYGEHWKIDGQLGPFAYPPTHWRSLPTAPREGK